MAYPEFRARPSRRQTVKCAFFLLFSAAIIAFATYNLAHAVFTGDLPTFSRHSHEVVHWALTPGRFILHFIFWVIGDTLFACGVVLFAGKLRTLGREADQAGGSSR